MREETLFSHTSFVFEKNSKINEDFVRGESEKDCAVLLCNKFNRPADTAPYLGHIEAGDLAHIAAVAFGNRTPERMG